VLSILKGNTILLSFITEEIWFRKKMTLKTRRTLILHLVKEMF